MGLQTLQILLIVSTKIDLLILQKLLISWKKVSGFTNFAKVINNLKGKWIFNLVQDINKLDKKGRNDLEKIIDRLGNKKNINNFVNKLNNKGSATAYIDMLIFCLLRGVQNRKLSRDSHWKIDFWNLFNSVCIRFCLLIYLLPLIRVKIILLSFKKIF